MSQEETKSIHIMIAGRTYPLKVKAEDENAIRDVVNEVNEKIKNFQLTYANRDKQDCLAMALLTYAVDFHKSAREANDNGLAERLGALERLLDEVLG